MKRFAFVPLIGGLALVVATVLLQGSNPWSFVSAASALISFGLSFAVIFALYSPADIRRAYQSVSMAGETGLQDLQVALNCFVTMQKVFLAVGPFGTLIGTVWVLEGLGRGSMEALGEGIAVAICAMIYSLLGVLLIALPGLAGAKKKLAILEAAS